MSGIYIPGIEMPTNCCECFAFKSNADGYLFCKAKRIAFGKEDAEWLPLKTPNWCPLVPVPEHGQLKDADALKNIVFESLNDAIADGNSTPLGRALCVFIAKNIADEIDALPTIVPADAPVMYYPQVPGITPTVIAEEVYDEYTDTAGNIHWTGTHSGKHIIPAEEGQ